MDVEIFRQYLADWGVSAQVLALVGGVSLLLFVISVRYVMKWYLGIQALEDEIVAARRQLASMQEQLNKMEVHGDFDSALPTQKGEPRTGTSDSTNKDRSFRLTH